MNNLLRSELINEVFFKTKKDKKSYKKKEVISKYFNMDLFWKHYYNPKLSPQINWDIRKYYLENYDLIQLKYKKKFTYIKKKRKSKKQKLQSIYDELNNLHNFSNPLKVID
tara:strand:+ start:77 stop:409 length:333 start_codon:yes stop_codon:yes gene_type:complete